jgi:uncharacterized damage-inducible protein DinB
MTRSLLADAFDHHTWASLRLIDACLGLSPEQLETSVPGTYGSIIETMRHLVGADTWYLHRLTDQRHPLIDEGGMDLAELRSAMERNAAAWLEVLATDPDADEVVSVLRDDGSETHATRGLRFAQAVHHGTDHRSQVCTALTALGIEPPNIDLWAYGEQAGIVTEVEPTS